MHEEVDDTSDGESTYEDVVFYTPHMSGATPFSSKHFQMPRLTSKRVMCFENVKGVVRRLANIPARKKMRKKTIFNLIGPLSSPAKVKRQVIGVFDKKWMKPFAEALKENKVIHAYIVHSDDGMDEISPFAKTNIVELKDGNISEFTIDPKDLGINSNNKENLKGKNAKYNSEKIIEICKGKLSEFSQSVALNVAAGLIVADKENDFKEAFSNASKHLQSGKVYEHLIKLQNN